MGLASDDIVLEIGGEEIRLLPSLRTALHLAYQHDDLADVWRAVADGNLTVISEVIALTSDRSLAEVRALVAPPLRDKLPAARHAVMQLLNAIMETPDKVPVPSQDDDDSGSSNEPLSFPAYFEQLAGLGMAMGWRPSEVWNCTPHDVLFASNALHVAHGGKLMPRTTPGSIPNARRDPIAKIRALAGPV